LRDFNVGITDGWIYELCCWDGVMCRDMQTKFHKDWSRRSKVNREATHTDTHTHTYRKVIS
jgi:hypothetical protein